MPCGLNWHWYILSLLAYDFCTAKKIKIMSRLRITYSNYRAIKSTKHDSDVILSTATFQITGIWTVCSTVFFFRHTSKKTSNFYVTGFVPEIHRWPVDSPHKGTVTQKMFPFDDPTMIHTRGFLLLLYNLSSMVQFRELSCLHPKTFTS